MKGQANIFSILFGLITLFLLFYFMYSITFSMVFQAKTDPSSACYDLAIEKKVSIQYRTICLYSCVKQNNIKIESDLWKTLESGKATYSCSNTNYGEGTPTKKEIIGDTMTITQNTTYGTYGYVVVG